MLSLPSSCRIKSYTSVEMWSLNRPPSYVLHYSLAQGLFCLISLCLLIWLNCYKYWVLQNQPHTEIILSSIVFIFPIIHNLQTVKVLFRLSPVILDVPRGLQLSWKWAVLFLLFLFFLAGLIPGTACWPVLAENLTKDSFAQGLTFLGPALHNVSCCTRQQLAYAEAF